MTNLRQKKEIATAFEKMADNIAHISQILDSLELVISRLSREQKEVKKLLQEVENDRICIERHGRPFSA